MANMDYQGNSKKMREGDSTSPSRPKIEKVIATPVVVKKRGLGRKFRDLFIEADLRTTVLSVALGVLVPAAKNMVLDAINKGSETLIYGESAVRRRNSLGQGTRITYNNPVNRSGYGGSPMRYAPSPSPDPRPNTPRLGGTEFILTTKEDAELVLENMNNVVDQFEIVSVADLNDLLGLPTNHVDTKWGWSNLSSAKITQIREGYLIDLPPAEPIS